MHGTKLGSVLMDCVLFEIRIISNIQQNSAVAAINTKSIGNDGLLLEMNRNGWGMGTCPENSKFGETIFGFWTLDV